MPVPGIGKAGFTMIGKIKKGSPKQETGMVIGRDLDYFRLAWKKGADSQKELFEKLYPKQPREIRFRLPFPDVDRNWNVQYECYKAGGRIAVANGTDETGLRWSEYRDPDTDDLLIRNGVSYDIRGEDLLKEGVNIQNPLYFYKNRNGNQVPVFLKLVGRLKLLMPELLSPSYIVFETTSFYDCNFISDELLGLEMMTKQMGGSLAHVPLVLFRRFENVPVTINGKRSRQDKSLCHVMANEDWSKQVFKALTVQSYPQIVGSVPKEIPDSFADNVPEHLLDDKEEMFTEADVKEGDYIEESTGDEAISPRGNIQKFWQHVRDHKIEQELALQIIKESGNDFDKAFKALLNNTLPD